MPAKTPSNPKYGVTEKTVKPWIDQHQCIQLYLGRLNNRKEKVAVNLYAYCQWTATQPNGPKTPEELLALKNSFENSDAEKLLDTFCTTNTNHPDSMKFGITNNVKGFYRANYKQLQSASGHFEYITQKSQGTLSKENRRALFKACYSPRDKALVMASTSTSIARETLSLITWDLLEENWQHQDIPCIIIPSQMIKGHGKGKYRGVKQLAFFTPETKRTLLEYRTWYQKTFNHTWKPNDHIFMNIRDTIHEPITKEGISRAIRYITKRTGIEFGIHDGRIIVQTALEDVGTSPQWIRKIKGRKIKGEESPYSKPAINQLREKIRQALPELQFLTEQDQTNNPKEVFLREFVQIIEHYPEKLAKFEQFILKL